MALNFGYVLIAPNKKNRHPISMLSRIMADTSLSKNENEN